jgi:IS5 family transposase
LIQKAREERIIKSRKLRLDTTVVEADIHHPTDADLLSDGVRVITRTVKKIIRTVESIKVQFRDRTRSVKKRILLISKILKQRSGDSYQKVREITGEIIDITQQVIKQAQQVAKNVTQQIICQDVDIPNKVCSAVQTLENFIVLTERVITQTAEVQQGNFHIPGRIISIFAPDDRPIRRGKLHAPTEFGRKLLLTETEERIITDYRVLDGNPKDDTLLVPAVDRFIETFGRPPWGVATDRGFSSAKNELIMKQRGVKRCSLPRKGKLSESRKKFQSQSWFKRLQHWRAGGEATISVLKRKYGLKCSRFRGDRGTKTWVGLGILAYNVRRIATLM